MQGKGLSVLAGVVERDGTDIERLQLRLGLRPRWGGGDAWGPAPGGLRNVCHTIGYEFNHHDALEDAKAAAMVVLVALQKTGLNLAEMLQGRTSHHRQRIDQLEVGLQARGQRRGSAVR